MLHGNGVAALALCTLLATACASTTNAPPPRSPEPPSREVTVVSDILTPEGPLYVDGNLYFVSSLSSTLAKWDGKTTTVLNALANCGHNGLALTKQRTFLVACSNHGAILELDMTGKELRRWEADDKGVPFTGGINDVVVTADGGAYATVFGPMTDDHPTAVAGKILHLAPGAKSWVEVANDLNYANGVAVSPDQKTLYVSETVGNCILKFTIEPDGSLSHRSNFALLARLTPNKHKEWFLGPDSMKVDSHGDIYVAQFFGGKVLKISPDGTLLHEFPILAGDGTTNVAFDDGERNLYVTVWTDLTADKPKGSVVKIPNVKADGGR